MKSFQPLPRLPMSPHLRVLSLSSPVAAQCPQRYERGLVQLRRRFDVSEGKLARAQSGHLVAPAVDRAEDLLAAWNDEGVDAILSVIGGMTTAQILEHLPLEEMAVRPKLVIGYSDTTSLLAALAHHGVPSLHGPALLPQFGEFDGPDPYALRSFLAALQPDAVGMIPEATEITSERLAWDREDVRPRARTAARTRRPIRPGHAEGPLFAGNLGTLLSLAGTPHFPDLTGAVLAVEEDDTETPDSIERMLTQLRSIGVLQRVRALVFGRLPAEVGMSDAELESAIQRAAQGTQIPLALGFELGHVDPACSLPIGARTRLVVTERSVSLEILESIFRR